MSVRLNIPKIHPGFVLKDELDENRISGRKLAKYIGVSPAMINQICRGRRGISAEMAWKLSRALGASPNFWMNLQNNWELGKVKSERFENLTRLAT